MTPSRASSTSLRSHDAPAGASARAQISRPEAYFGQLDALRAFAVLIVVWQHAGSGPTVKGFGLHGVGVYGVWLFFVLSGFLISGILLRSRDHIQAGRATLSRSFLAFYTRRSLRIFPVYYVLLAVAAAFGLASGFREYWPWHALYATNWLAAVQDEWPRAAGHLWSLAVEEQFYLVWPAVILLTPARRLPAVLLCTAATALVWRAAFVVGAWSSIRTLTPTPASLDALGLGALLAWHRHAHPDAVHKRERYTRVALIAGLLLLAVTVALSMAGRGLRLFALIECTSVALISVWVIDRAATGFGGAAGAVLRFGPLVYIGRISYGVYLFHHVLIYGLRHWAGVSDFVTRVAPTEGAAFFLVVTAASVAVASLSWFMLEKPVMKLKRSVSYA